MAFKKPEWVNPDQMKVSSGCEPFDEQTNLIAHGNVIANTMYGSFVRGQEENTSYGHEFPPLHLHRYDLKPFRELGVVGRAYQWASETLKDGGILYVFYHHTSSGSRIVHGLIATDVKHRYLGEVCFSSHPQSLDVLREVGPYVCEDYGEETHLLWL